MFQSINKNPNAKEIRKFSLMLLIGMPVAGALWTGIFWWVKDVLHLWILIVFAAIGVTVYCLSLLSRPAGRTCYIIWHSLGAVFETVISFLSTLIMYCLSIVPIGLIMKLFGRKPLPVRFDRSCKSYWKDCKEPGNLKRYFRQY